MGSRNGFKERAWLRGAVSILIAIGAAGCGREQPRIPETDLAEAQRFQAEQRTDTAANVPVGLNSQDSETPKASWQQRLPDEIAPGFTLLISNPDDAGIRGKATVGHNGMVKLPYDVEVRAEGLTAEDLKRELNREYQRYLRNPKFDVKIESRRYSVDVRGLVERPGPYAVEADSSLDELMAKAGGLQRNEDSTRKAKYARVNQKGLSKLINLQDYFSGTPNLVPQWQGGESVFFQNEGPGSVSVDREYIQILGQVESPGAYPFRRGGDFVSYLTLAGGPTDRADLNRITLLRRNGAGLQQQNFELSDEYSAAPVKAGDTLIVHADSATKMERNTGIAAGFAAVVSAIALVAAL